jgi:prefoldin subunit 5
MSVTVEFLDEERTMISGHGETGIEDGFPVFDNATTVGHFTKGYIDNVEINGETKRCVLGKGFLDEMRYKPFIESLETEINNGNSVDGSIEIYRSEGNENIVYKKGWIPQGRIPTEFIHSGWAMVLNPADVNSTLLELNSKNKNKEELEMDEKTMRDVIVTAIHESNSKNDELNATIAELNSTIESKDAEIVELNATVEQVQKALDDLKKEHETYWAERDALEKELGALKAKARIGELNSAIEGFSEDEKKYAESEINSFNEDPMAGDVDAIVSKIYAGIGQASKETAKVAEQNSANNETELDIFSEINSVEDAEDNDVNIF